MATARPIRDWLQRAYKAKDASELEQIGNEAEEVMPPDEEERNEDHIHIHLPGHQHDDEGEMGGGELPSPGGEGGADPGLVQRLEAIEEGIEEMRADHEEMQQDLEEVLGDESEELNEEGGGSPSDSFHDARRRVRDRRRSRDMTRSAADRIRDARAARDAYRADCDARRAARDAGAEGTNTKIEGDLEAEAPPGTGDAARKARDSAFLDDSWQETVSMAEIIVPGQSFPTFDVKAKPADGLSRIVDVRRRTLDAAYADASMRKFLDDAGYGARSKTMDCGEVRTIFRALAALQRERNNGSARVTDTGMMPVGGKIRNLADLAKANDEYWAKQNRRPAA